MQRNMGKENSLDRITLVCPIVRPTARPFLQHEEGDMAGCWTISEAVATYNSITGKMKKCTEQGRREDVL